MSLKKAFIERVDTADWRYSAKRAAAELGRGARVLLVAPSASAAKSLRAAVRAAMGDAGSARLECASLNSMIESAPAFSVEPGRTAIGFVEKLSILYSILAADDPRYMGEPSFARLVSGAISELSANFCDASNFTKFAKKRADNPVYSKIAKIYAAYERRKEKLAIVDFEDRATRLSASHEYLENLAASYDIVIFESPKKMTGAEIELSARIVAFVGRAVMVAESFGAPHRVSAAIYSRILKQIASHGVETEIDAKTSSAEGNSSHCFDPAEGRVVTEPFGKTFRSNIVSGGFAARALTFADPLAEAEGVAREILSIHLTDGTPLERFAIYAPMIGRYQKAIGAAFERYGVPYAANEGKPLAHEAAGAGIMLFLKFIFEPSADTLSLLAYNFPSAAFGSVARNMSHNEFRDALRKARVFDAPDAKGAARIFETAFSRDAGRELAAGAAASIAGFISSAIAARSKKFRTLSEFFNAVRNLMKDAGLDPSADLRAVKVFSMTLSQVETHCARFSRYPGHAMSFDEAMSLFDDVIRKVRVPSNILTFGFKNEAERGGAVEVHSREGVLAGDYDHLFIMGGDEAGLSQMAREDASFFDGDASRELGLESFSAGPYCASFMFHGLLRLAARSVTITAPYADSGRESMPSPLLAEVAGLNIAKGIAGRAANAALTRPDAIDLLAAGVLGAPRKKICESFAIDENSAKALIGSRSASAACVESRETAWSGPFAGDLSNVGAEELLKKAFSWEGDALKLSASRVEKFIFCPMSFYFTHVLGLTMREEFDEDLDARAEGELIHSILEAFFSDPAANEIMSVLTGGEDEERKIRILRGLYSAMYRVGAEKFDAHPKLIERTEFYRRMKALQYFNGLEGFVPPPGADQLDGAPGIFKIFIDDHLDFVCSCQSRPAVLGTECALRVEAGEVVSRAAGGVDALIDSRIDRIDIWPDRENDAVWFMIIDYKTGSVPAPGDIKSGKKVQATLYLHALEKFLHDSVRRNLRGERGSSSVGARRSEAADRLVERLFALAPWIGPDTEFVPVGFMYQSVTKQAKPGKLVRTFFIDKEQAGRKDKRIKTAARALKHDEFIEMVQHACEPLAACVAKVARGDFHMSVNKNHDCGLCDFTGICHWNKAAVDERLGRNRAGAANATYNSLSDGRLSGGER